jgi:hypothetical protein
MLMKRGTIMPERFADENDENHHIQHVLINRPDFNMRETTKTFTTHEDTHHDSPAPRKSSNL